MQRVDFITKTGQLFLIAALALTAVLLGRRVTTGLVCGSCPGRGVCSDFSDCSTYLSLKKDEEKAG